MWKASQQEDIHIYLADDWVTIIPDQKKRQNNDTEIHENSSQIHPKFMTILPKSIQNATTTNTF